jgi:hypothetical protein
MAGERDKGVTRVTPPDRGVLGFRLGPVRRAVYGFLESGPSSEPISTQETKPADELERMADRAARRYRERVEKAVETYKKRWVEAMRK